MEGIPFDLEKIRFEAEVGRDQDQQLPMGTGELQDVLDLFRGARDKLAHPLPGSPSAGSCNNRMAYFLNCIPFPAR